MPPNGRLYAQWCVCWTFEFTLAMICMWIAPESCWFWKHPTRGRVRLRKRPALIEFVQRPQLCAAPVCVFVHPLQRVRNRLNKMQISRLRPPGRLPPETTGARTGALFFWFSSRPAPDAKSKLTREKKSWYYAVTRAEKLGGKKRLFFSEFCNLPPRLCFEVLFLKGGRRFILAALTQSIFCCAAEVCLTVPAGELMAAAACIIPNVFKWA